METGLASSVSSESWNIEIDEYLDCSEEAYAITITNRCGMSVQFHLGDSKRLEVLAEFLGKKGFEKEEKYREHTLSTSIGTLHFVVTDSRFLIRALGKSSFGGTELWQMKFDAAEASSLAAGLSLARDDLE